MFRSGENNILRGGSELLTKFSLPDELPCDPRNEYLNKDLKEKYSAYQKKVMHGYVSRKLEDDANINRKCSISWLATVM